MILAGEGRFPQRGCKLAKLWGRTGCGEWSGVAGEWEGGMLGAGNEQHPKVMKVMGGSSLVDRLLEAMRGFLTQQRCGLCSVSL